MEKLRAGAQRMGLTLGPQQIGGFELYFKELVAWNHRVNLTAITDRDRVQTLHFLDSLTVALALDGAPQASIRVLDVGSGGGLPGIPLKLLYPDIRLTLVEATMKKARFLTHVADALETEIEVLCTRAEVLGHDPEHREGYDLVLSRAVAPLPTLVELTLPFCRTGGMAIALKKGDIEPEMLAAAAAIDMLGGTIREPRRLSLPELGDDRCLIIIDKVAPTPLRYPRRTGIPKKRPLKAAA